MNTNIFFFVSLFVWLFSQTVCYSPDSHIRFEKRIHEIIDVPMLSILYTYPLKYCCCPVFKFYLFKCNERSYVEVIEWIKWFYVLYHTSRWLNLYEVLTFTKVIISLICFPTVSVTIMVCIMSLDIILVEFPFVGQFPCLNIKSFYSTHFGKTI